MQWFIAEGSNTPGELARHAEAIAERGINLSNVICLGVGDRGTAAFYAKDEAGLRTALNDAGIAFGKSRSSQPNSRTSPVRWHQRRAVSATPVSTSSSSRRSA